MALTDENSGGFVATMPMAPAYGGGYGGGFGNGFGGDGWWVLLLLLAFGGGWGNGFGGGDLYPWLNNSQNINGGFRDQMLNSQIGDIQNAINSGFGNVATQLCGGFAGVNATVNGAQNAISQQLYANEIASLNRSFAEQTANTAGFTATNTGIADLKYTIASEACADRAAVTAGIQTVLDKLCQLELDGYKREADQLRAENSVLKNQGFIANEINQQNEVFYNRLKNCPVNAVPVAGNTPLFSCNPSFNTPGCGCGNGSF